MRYVEFRDANGSGLRGAAAGLLWAQLQKRLGLPYDRPCPTLTQQLERDIGLRRTKGADAGVGDWRSPGCYAEAFEPRASARGRPAG